MQMSLVHKRQLDLMNPKYMYINYKDPCQVQCKFQQLAKMMMTKTKMMSVPAVHVFLSFSPVHLLLSGDEFVAS